MFVRDATLMAQPFDADRLELTGAALPLAEQIQSGNPPVFMSAFSVSEAGTLVFQAGASPVSQLIWLDRSGKEIGLLAEAASFEHLQVSTVAASWP